MLLLLLSSMATGGSLSSSAGSASECGALRGSARGRGRSYGSLTARVPGVNQRHLEHRPRSGDTLQGLALRYGTEQIKRANRLYTNDSIFLKESIRIPAPKQETLLNGVKPEAVPGADPAVPTRGGRPSTPEHHLSPELSPADFLKRLDSKITESKAAAIRKLTDGGARLEGGECGSPISSTGHKSSLAPAQVQRRAPAQRARLGPVRLTKNIRVTTLRETEDEIFDL
ncbi:lysM and putative peptidoglycan-binding domain-containing protein 1 isoform X2 [Cetorhinus maximus]